MRPTMRALAIIALAVFGLGLLWDTFAYLANPCPSGWGGLAFLLLPFFAIDLGLPLALIGSVPAAALAAARRQWGWFAGLLAAALSGLALLVILSGNSSPLVSFPAAALVWIFDHVFGLTCGGQSSPFSQALGLSLPFLAAPLALFGYGYSRASAAPERTVSARRLLWVGVIIALALNALLSLLRLTRVAPVQDVLAIPTIAFPVIGSGGIVSPWLGPWISRIGYLVSPVGVLLAYVMGGVLAVLAVRRREWAWFVGLVVLELATIALYYVIAVPSVIIPLTYQNPAFADLPVTLPIVLPLASLAYVSWSGRRPGRGRAEPGPSPSSA